MLNQLKTAVRGPTSANGAGHTAQTRPTKLARKLPMADRRLGASQLFRVNVTECLHAHVNAQ